MGSLEFRTENRQSHSLSPRLQHAVRLLQMSSLDFSAMLHDMVGKNPFLEPEESSDSPSQSMEESTEAPISESQVYDASDTFGDHDIWHADRTPSVRKAEDGELSALEMTAEETSLRSHLHSQLHLLRLSERDLVLASVIVESLDDDGYLRTPLEELATVAGLEPSADPEEMLIALRQVQSLGPMGIGARSVSECLQLQLPNIDCPTLRALGEKIVNQHLPKLAAKDVNGLAQALHTSPARVEEICLRLRRLDPRPGWRYASSQAAYVVPDILTKKVRGQWTVQLNPAVVPKLKLNQVYAELFRRHRAAENAEMASHLQEARWTLHNVEQRFSTIMDVAEAIVRRQRHFLEFGAMAMKPLGLREIADEIGVHESTVSRVTNNKYMATPSGVFELKYFFSRVMLSSNGSECSGTAIRGLIKDIIETEKADKPFSDAEITRQLAQQGLVVARRTVTKYRQLLRIESVERRKRHS